MNSKRKRIASAILLMTMSTTIFNTNVFAGGGASVVTANQGNNDSTGQTPTTLPSGTEVNGSNNTIINGSGNNIIINQIQAPISTGVNQSMNSISLEKESTDEKEGHLFVGKEIENKTIEEIVDIPLDDIKSVTIKDGVTSIGEWAFDGCTGLTSITIPNSVTSIGDGAFNKCQSLTSINIPDGVTEIGKFAFSGCTGLTSITIPNSVTSIGDGAFGCTGLTSITIPNSVTSIGEWAFQECSSLTSITIPNSVTSISSYAFYGCTGLKEVTVPKSAKIDDNAFKDCPAKINRI